VLDLQLPSTQFPVGTLVADANSGLSGTVYQATAGNTWSTSLTMVNPTTQYKVSSTTDNPSLNVTTAVLSISPWPTTGNWDGFWTANFTLNNPTAQDLDYWLTTVAVPSSPATPCHVLNLNSVSGIAIGDGLMVVDSDSSASFTVAGVDPILNQVSTVEAISNLPLGTHIYWDETSQGDMVLEDPGVILQAAMAPFSVDLSKFTAPSTADPTFGFLPMRPLNGADVQPVGDIEPTLTGLKLSTGATYLNPADGTNVKSYSWTGTPDTGWATPTGSAGAAPNADWTCQLVAAPTSLMPYEVACTTAEFPNGINPFQRLRNRAYSDTVYFQENNGLIIVNNKIINGAYVQTVVGTTITYQYTQNGVTYNSATGDNFTPWSPAWAYLAGALAVYDYQTMKRFIFNGTAQVQAKAWSGTAWGAPTLYTWPGSSCVQSAVPMVGMAGSILAYATDATLANPRLELWGFSGGLTASLSLAAYAGLVGGTLVRTPYGAYLVCGYNLAQITYSAGALHLVLISMAGEVDVLFANTLVARNAGEIAIFGRVQDGDNTECWMFRIFTPFQSTLNNASLWSEKIGEGCPTLMGAMRDPSKPGRIVGHYGGQLWQIDTVRPMCIERFTPGGMTALECVEHVCQAMAAMAIPDANGTMHIISRNPADSPLALTVSQVSVSSTLSWPDFASIVRITSQDSKFYFDAFGQQGGVLLEVGNHPMVWSLSACAGMAESWCAWFGQPRAMSEEEWFYTDPNTGAPWESIQLFTKLSVNGGPNVRLMSRSQNFIAGSATVKTVGA